MEEVERYYKIVLIGKGFHPHMPHVRGATKREYLMTNFLNGFDDAVGMAKDLRENFRKELEISGASNITMEDVYVCEVCP